MNRINSASAGVNNSGYELVCGLETHVELATATKIFCGCPTGFGGEPNSRCCPVCLGHPGTLPVLNKEAVRLAVRAGLALGCEIHLSTHMDRKNYTYPDLPKAYQISQFDEPLCTGGFVELDSGKRIGITRIHIEEDAGKLVHDAATLIDNNRCGVPLIEIVSEPDIRTAGEAAEYAEKLRLIMRAAGVSDCRMQEGSMRCDCNVSIRKAGEDFGTRTEIKNVSSLSDIERAVRAEMSRQKEILDAGGKVVQATLRYDSTKNRTEIMRLKENADDYRFFPEPDIFRFVIPQSVVDEERAKIPELPSAKRKRYIGELGLPEETVGQFYGYSKITAFFEDALGFGASAKNTANLLIKALYPAFVSEDEKEEFKVKVTPAAFAELVKNVDDKKINFNRGAEILSEMNRTGKPASAFLSEADTKELTDKELESICLEAIAANPAAVSDMRDGKEKAINVLFGYIMKKTSGKADTKKAAEIIKNNV